jgi:MoxR-like ATPase
MNLDENNNSKLSDEQLSQAKQICDRILSEVGHHVIGQSQLKRRLLSALVAEGHILLEGVPGLAKTLSIKAIAKCVAASFSRIQFTPDLLPADLIGTEIYRPQNGTFEVRKGPVFANFVLADEINRAPAKVQSALLETMQEQQVTIGEQTLFVPKPFFVMATQNPIDQEGTYPLPEAQVDRFLMKIKVDYPTAAEELEMLDLVTKQTSTKTEVKAVASLDDIALLKGCAQDIYVDERVRQYIIDIVWATRDPKEKGLSLENLLELGASPRAAIALFQVARAEALLLGERYVVPQMIKNIAHDVLRHRIVPSYEAEAEGFGSDELITMVLDGVDVP